MLVTAIGTINYLFILQGCW